MGVSVHSEIGNIEEVVVHTPGREIEAMTPETANEVLYNEIIPLSLVSEQHATLKRLLSTLTRTRELTDLFTESIRNDEAKAAFVRDIADQAGIHERIGELQELSSEELVATMVTGLKQQKDTITAALSGVEFDLPPLPNLYFMRDGAAVIRDGVVISAMANAVRIPESLMVSYVFTHHPEYAGCRIHFNGTRTTGDHTTVEGGDILVARSDLILVGISERTTAEAADVIGSRLAGEYREPITIIAVVLPAKRATIHLDMIFTFVDNDAALVYAPYVTGKSRLNVLKLDVDPVGRTHVTEYDGILSALKSSGVDVQPITCGGDDPLLQEREQWLSAANVFAVAPGKIVGYDCNSATAEQLSKAGFEITHATDFINGIRSIDEYERVFIGIPGVELARGGGGVRCMTLPLRRAPINT